MKLRTTFVLLAGAFLFASTAVAAPNNPDASITFETMSVSAGIGGSKGEGILNYKGYEIPMKISGYTIGEAGIVKKKGYGFAYNLKNLSDFSGDFSAQTGTVALLSGVGYQRLDNDKKVFVELRSKETGVNLGFAGGGITMELDADAVRNTLAALNAPKKQIARQSIYFDTNSSTVREADKPKLQELVNALHKGQASEVVVTGYTDASGQINKNIELSQQRAFNAYMQLKQLAQQSGLQKLPPKRVNVFGGGEAGGPAGQVNQANRRVDVAVVYKMNPEKVYR